MYAEHGLLSVLSILMRRITLVDSSDVGAEIYLAYDRY